MRGRIIFKGGYRKQNVKEQYEMDKQSRQPRLAQIVSESQRKANATQTGKTRRTRGGGGSTF